MFDIFTICIAQTIIANGCVSIHWAFEMRLFMVTIAISA